MTANLYDHLIARAPQPDAVAMETDGGDPSRYSDLARRSAQMAQALVELGVTPGARVAAQIEKSVNGIVLYLATIRAGAVFLPLNTGYTAAEIGYFLNDAEPAVFVCDPAQADALAGVAAEAGARLVTLGAAGDGSLAEAAERASTEFDTVPRGEDDLAALLYTSGTTGRSKGAMLTHGNLLSNARTLCEAWRFSADDVLIHALPIFHTHGLFVAINVAFLSGASMIFLPKFDPLQVLSLMPRATVLMGVPTFYTRLLDQPGLTREACAGMRLFVSGSAPLLEETHHAWSERTGHAILERYGMTETNMTISNPYDGARIAGTVGLPLPGVDLRLTDPASGQTVPPGEVGMIEVRGPNVFKGYWRMPEKTAEELRADGFFITGDLGQFDANGYLQIVGRSKDLVISGGLNVYPREVEAEIDALPAVLESAVIGVRHRDFGEAVLAVVVRRGEISVEAILEALQGRLARFKQPKAVVFVDELPRNTMGKVQKNLLRERFAGVFG
ncbi:malonate--CoA ligase [Halodurantibacterium flavum]|uniref:Malonyl-CoA synthase n=1 Tax=Halodurantibacterium flavum TaxID=1382802 RepID=A0ABW4S0H3_9RHOB